MYQDITKRNFSRHIQKAFLACLPHWKPHRTSSLYQKTEYFVQFLTFATSAFEVRRTPEIFIQPLALQKPYIMSSVVYRIRNQQGGEVWFSIDDWKVQRTSIIDYTLTQIKPVPLQPLTDMRIYEYAQKEQKERATPHMQCFFGLLAVSVGKYAEGITYLQQAEERLRMISTEWAREESTQIREWISGGEKEVQAKIAASARQGAHILQVT